MSLLLWGRVRLLLLIWTLSESVFRNVLAGSICTTGQCSGVTAWHGPQTEHDLGWRSAADADHLCHWGGFQGSAMAAALTSLGRHTRAHTHASALHTLWGQRPGMTYFDYSVLKQQVMGFPGCHLCRWPLFRDSIQDPGRAGWQHARSTSELSYHWHQVSRRCHVFILWEFNPPFRMDQALCRWREGCADKCSHTSSRECLGNNPWDAGMLNKGCFIGDHEAIHFPNLLVS